MREKEGDTRQKGEEWRASEQQSNALSLLKQDQITASPVETVGMVQSNIQHCAQRILREQDIGEAAHRDRMGCAFCLFA